MEDIAPYLERAQRIWNGGPFDYSVATGATNDAAALVATEMLVTRMSSTDRGRFTLRYRDDLLAAQNVTILVQCTAVDLEWDASSHPFGAQSWRAATARGPIAARAFVLAAGGVENVQLLLTSEATRPGGPANPHDVIGRWITDHPEFRMAVVTPTDESVLDRLGLYDIRWVRNSMVSGFLTLRSR